MLSPEASHRKNKEGIEMTVFVALELSDGRIGPVRVFLRPESAEQARQKWLKEQGVKDGTRQEAKTGIKTELVVMECELKP